VAEFLAMGGYAAYVWTAFGVTLVCLVGNLYAARRRFNRTRARLQARAAHDLARRRAT
jgi:heme exporter protein D